MRAKALCAMVALCSAGALAAPGLAAPEPVKAAVLRSQGTYFLGMTIWNDLNTGWSQFGETPVQIDYRSLAGFDWTVSDIAATGADVLILSAPGYLGYSDAEIDAIMQYVEAGHGIIYTYGLFRGNQSRLAPLAGLSEGTTIGSNTWLNPFAFDLLVPDHPVFRNVSDSYATGTTVLTSPQPLGSEWLLTTGTVLARANPSLGTWTGNGIIVANQGSSYRGLFFANYPENKEAGANLQDMQVFYNGLLWTPEPTTALFVLTGAGLFLRPKRRR